MPTPPIRIRPLNTVPERADGEYVLYWMVAARRLEHNFALDRALERARALRRPLLVLEALRCDYPWASDRLHRFILDGMRDHASRLGGGPVGYHPFVEREPGEGRGLLQALARRACLVVTDDFPAFFLPRMVEAAGRHLESGAGIRLEAVDGNGLLPLRAADRVFARAFDFRRFLQRELPRHLGDRPQARPLADFDLPDDLPPFSGVPRSVQERWPRAGERLLSGAPEVLGGIPIDHRVGPVSQAGDRATALALLERFVSRSLPRYHEAGRHPDEDATSGLSPYLHFGRISVHEVFAAVGAAEDWSPARLGDRARGARQGWWGMGQGAEAFVDQLVTWRELGAGFCWQRADAHRYEALPDWARQTLEDHLEDPRPVLYRPEQLLAAETDDAIWNAAQRQLLREGRIHNYLRMVWGKRILEWTPHPREAMEVMVALNDRLALDGRDPNSYAGIAWVLGRYDRAWGPERPIYGKVRYMSSANTRRKLRCTAYLERFGADAS